MDDKSYEVKNINALQNRFSAYLKNAVHNYRIDYLFKQGAPQREFPTEDPDIMLPMDSFDFTVHIAEYDALQRVLRRIKERERYILLARVIEDKNFAQIANEVGMSYKATAAVYYRTIAKLRYWLGGDRNEF